MSDTSVLWSPAAWLNSAHIEQWLRDIWPSWRMDDVRRDWDEGDRWFWVIPDYDKGRSRVIGIPRSVLEQTTVTRLREVLEEADWLARIDQDALLVSRSPSGMWSVESWDPAVEEKWFKDPAGGYFVAFRDTAPLVTSAPAPARLPSPFIALHGKAWSAVGPTGLQPVVSYALDELLPFLPENRAPAS